MNDFDTKEIPFTMEDGLTEEGVFSGYASTFGGAPDSYGDVIDFGAYADTIRKQGKFGLGVGMLYQHDRYRPVGKWLELVENKRGLKARGQLATKSTDGNDAYIFMKMGILKAMSIGWELLKLDSEGLPVALEDAMEFDDKKKIRRLKKIDLWEISPVMFPANNRARIDRVKSAIEDAKTVRELEGALKESGLSINTAKYITKLCKDKLGIENTDRNMLSDMLNTIESVRKDVFVSSLLGKVSFDLNLREVGSGESGNGNIHNPNEEER